MENACDVLGKAPATGQMVNPDGFYSVLWEVVHLTIQWEQAVFYGIKKTRPLKIIWADIESKRTFMKELSNLKGIDEESPYYGISVTHDMTKEIAESAKTNRKTFWKYVNSKRKSISGISELHTKVNGTEFIASTDSEKAEVQAEFFSSVFTLESGKPVDSGKKYCDNFSSDELFNSKEVNKLLKDLNTSKSPGPDQVHPKVLFELANTIDSPLSTIFNESFKIGTVPQRWKIGQISALFKKGDKTS
ncbi:unnamed protein product [Mytilus coruscus]|uniref:Reverse transcriptase domain-containing protein n=1 Tax=Mytilus coruscus TaxID=42192 RepID=A0A6J8CLW2_MYTCO|nr:unnamed protein product [Mytilus coruscus]